MESILTKISEAGTFRFFEDILNKGFTLRVKVTGSSMTPFLKGGEILTIKKVRYSSLCTGDIIFFRNPYGFPVLHRLVRKKKIQNNILMFQTKGDSMMSFDEPVHYTAVLGKVCTIDKVISHGKIKSIDMESFFLRNLNYLTALCSIFKSKTYFTIRRIYRIKQQFFTKHKSSPHNS